MATGLDPVASIVSLTVCHAQQKVTLYVSPEDRVDTIIRKAADSLKENPAGLQLLYQGTAVPDDATVKVTKYRVVMMIIIVLLVETFC